MLTDSQKAGYERSAKKFDAYRPPSSRRDHKAMATARNAMMSEGIPLYYESICNRAARLLRECIAKSEPLP